MSNRRKMMMKAAKAVKNKTIKEALIKKEEQPIMPKHAEFKMESYPIYVRGRKLRMAKAYTFQDFSKSTVLTDDVFPYVMFHYSSHPKAMRFSCSENKDKEIQKEEKVSKLKKYGNPQKYDYRFYWEQAENFYRASKVMSFESSPVAAYYCMLNAVKSYLAYTCNSVDEFVGGFAIHGLTENSASVGEDISTVEIFHKENGVFPLFAKKLDSDFESKWKSGKNNSKTLKSLLYNLPFVHRAYSMTYVRKGKKVEELFIPLKGCEAPCFYKGNDGKAYLSFELDKNYFAPNAMTIPMATLSSISSNFEVYNGLVVKSKNGATYQSGSISNNIRTLNSCLRKEFSYIRSDTRLWYLKRTELKSPDVINLSDMTINMAAMHRVSEIARYKPEQLHRFMQSKENWLLHEYISQALDQFVDEIAAEITKRDIMGSAIKTDGGIRGKK